MSSDILRAIMENVKDVIIIDNVSNKEEYHYDCYNREFYQDLWRENVI